jgi:hypothetical protein
MPLQIDIRQGGKQIRKNITLSGKSNTVSIPLDNAPTEITLDPDHWVLMDTELTASAVK